MRFSTLLWHPKISRSEIATTLSADYGRTIRVEDVEAGEEWLRNNVLPETEPANTLPDTPQVTGTNPAEPKTKQTLPVSNPQDTVPAGSQQPTGSVQSPSQPPTTPSLPPTTPPPAGNTPPSTTLAASQPPPSSVQTPPPPVTKMKTITIEVPEGVEITPIAEIDGEIRNGYVDRLGLEAIMKHRHQGRAYRNQIQQRLDLYKDRLPPFDNIPVATLPVVSGMQPANIWQRW